MFKKILTL
jgi:hypothetical protein